MESQVKSLRSMEEYMEMYSRKRYEVNSDREKGIMKHLPKLSSKANMVVEKSKPIDKIEVLPFTIVSRNKGEKFYALRLFSPKKIYSNLEYLIEWKDSGKREYVTKAELDKLSGK